jgi:hypothetical protein
MMRFELGDLISNIVGDFGIQINSDDRKRPKINYEDEAEEKKSMDFSSWYGLKF